MSVDVTAIVPVRNRRDRMLRCLDALLAQDHPSYEILVLDNGSTDGTGEACLARAAGARVPVRVVRIEGTLGYIRNRGAELAAGRYVAFTDSDCMPRPSWLSTAVRALDEDPGLGFVCGRTVAEEEPVELWARTVQVPRFSYRFESCNVVFRAEALRASAGFDEVIGDGWEDTAAGFDLLTRGWRVAFLPDAVVVHDVTYPGFWWHVRREQRQQNLARVVRRYPEVRRRLLFARVFFHMRSAACLLALGALAAGRRRRRALLAVLPYALFLLRVRHPREMARLLVFDLALHVAMLRGSARYRSLLI